MSPVNVSGRQRYVVEVIDDVSAPTIDSLELPDSPRLPDASLQSPPEISNPTVSSQKTPSFSQTFSQNKVSDPFQDKQKKVEELFRESQLEESAKEGVLISPPPSAKKNRGNEDTFKTVANTREQAFQSHLETPPPAKIEQFYQQSRDKSVSSQKEEGRAASFFSQINSFFGELSFIKRSSEVQKIPKTMGWKFFLVMGIASIILLVSTALLGGFFWVRADLRRTQEQAELLLRDVEQGQIQSAEERLEALREKQKSYAKFYSLSRPIIHLVFSEEKVSHIDKILGLSQSGLRLIENGLNTYALLDTGYQEFMGQSDGDSIQTLTKVSGQLEAIFMDLSTFQAELTKLDNPFNITFLDVAQDKVQIVFPDLRRSVLAAQQLSQALPVLLAEGERKQYVVLLQNNSELRPTGGFIGSFAVLTVADGVFENFEVMDVYDADGQLDGYVTPPVEIVEHLGEPQWWLRDVNWSPDFPTVSTQAQWFLDKEIRLQPDGVIGINMEVAKKLLAVTGPIQLVDFDAVVTQDTLYSQAQTYAEINFFPGSKQKKDFLSAVATHLFDKLSRGDTNKLKILQAFYNSAEEAQLFVSLNDERAQQAFVNLGWSGALLTPDCPPPFHLQTCVMDTVMQVEANVGVNKANQFIEREIDHEVQLQLARNDEGKRVVVARHERRVTFTNAAQSTAWPEGAYKQYFRLFMPMSGRLESVKIDGTEIDISVVREQTEGKKRSFGFPITVPIRSSTVVEVAYQVEQEISGGSSSIGEAGLTANNLASDENLAGEGALVNQPTNQSGAFVYSFFEQKQSGVSDDLIRHTISVPSGIEVLTVAPQPSIDGRSISFLGNRKTHQIFAVELE